MHGRAARRPSRFNVSRSSAEARNNLGSKGNLEGVHTHARNILSRRLRSCLCHVRRAQASNLVQLDRGRVLVLILKPEREKIRVSMSKSNQFSDNHCRSISLFSSFFTCRCRTCFYSASLLFSREQLDLAIVTSACTCLPEWPCQKWRAGLYSLFSAWPAFRGLLQTALKVWKAMLTTNCQTQMRRVLLYSPLPFLIR